jgi:DNA-binding transcriptional regulator WhiA
MKQIFLIVAFVATCSVQNGFAQDNTNDSKPGQLLDLYYQVKDALLKGNPALAATTAEAFSKSALVVKGLPEADRKVLLKDAAAISSTKDLKEQRVYLADFSEHMYALAKSVKLSTDPIYKIYCPMKKANWLSKESAIKNPYYGSAMLTCGKVTETLK